MLNSLPGDSRPGTMTARNIPVVVEQFFGNPKNEVWASITEPEQMKEWFFENIPAFEPVAGFKTAFPVTSGNRTFTHLWKILEVIPWKLISYDWRYREYEGEGLVTFELFEKNDGTLLRLTNVGLETFPVDVPEFARESCLAGWEYFIQKRLRDYLDA